MTTLSAETRRMLDLSRDSDDPTPACELAVRNRLIARLGVTVLVGVAGASAVGSVATKAVSAGATAAVWAKTVATIMVVASLGASVQMSDDHADRAVESPVAVAGEVKRVIKLAWQLVTNGGDDVASAHAPEAVPPPPVRAGHLHERLIAIARRPNRPVAKEAELALIVAAERALAAGDVDRAKDYLDRHAAQFADGELRADREALRGLCVRVRGDTNF